jgi:hypothetical protein
VRVEDERVGLFQPVVLGPSRRMPRSPSSARTCSPTHDLFARHHDLLLRLTAFACIRYFRHELFVDAQSLVFKLLFPFCLPGSISSIDAKRKVRDIPIATGPRRYVLNSSALSGSSECSDVRIRGRRGWTARVRPARPGLTQNMDDRRWLCDDTARRQS